MNYIQKLTQFFDKAQADPTCSATTISLFMALFQLWNQARFVQQLQITRQQAMQLAKISSKATYHKTMTYLHNNGYIDYQPSYNPYKGSTIIFYPNRPKKAKTKPITRQVQEINTRPINEPFNKLYKSNIIMNNIRLRALKKNARDFESKNSQVQNIKSKAQKEKSSAKKEKTIPPQPHHVEEFFIEQKSTILEAHKFINHYTANGWLVGGKSPMKNWNASARNWITNSITYNANSNTKNETPKRPQHLSATTHKNYDEPL
ncbi:transcriptional regulator [Sphingobacterium psychroaquaticum]|uniref:transcriptional regulator n=1 Tax=Sphingobacterium psychroaquaticum TaxID=561061 RepID=UPI00106C75AC|nr:transcriptional regulator [Sphingobacterium psychroaquaticum]QBQ41291.1 transcriptional regulator [Sphingobacterium psychroaquaticum]